MPRHQCFQRSRQRKFNDGVAHGRQGFVDGLNVVAVGPTLIQLTRQLKSDVGARGDAACAAGFEQRQHQFVGTGKDGETREILGRPDHIVEIAR